MREAGDRIPTGDRTNTEPTMYSEHDLFLDLRSKNTSTFTHRGHTFTHGKQANGYHTVTTEDGRTAVTPATSMFDLRGAAAWILHSTKTKQVTFDYAGNVTTEQR